MARRWTLNDFNIALGLWGDSRVIQFISATRTLEENEVKAKLEEQIQLDKEFGIQYWVLETLSEGKEIGCAGLRPYDLDKGVYEIGFHIMHAFWGLGYATEAANGVIDFSKTIGVKKLFAGHNPANEASSKVLKKLGFAYLRDEFYGPTGLMHPSYELTL